MNIGYLIVELIKIECKYSDLYNDHRNHIHSYRVLTDISDKLLLTRNILGPLIKHKNSENINVFIDYYTGNKTLFPGHCEFIEKELLPLIKKAKIQSRNSKLNKI